MTLAELLNNVSSALASVLGWIPDIFDTMVTSPVVIILICFAAIGTVVGFTKKLLKM